MRHLEVIYGDNDFGYPVHNAVKKVYDWIFTSNDHCINKSGRPSKHFSSRTIAGIFLKLHKVKALEPMIQRTYQIEYYHGNVEFMTRGLYWPEVDWEKKIPLPLENDPPESYLGISLKFRKNKNFMKNEKWGNNGESLCLDLETGEIITHW